MNTVSKSLRLQIGIFGRTNVGKSSFLNMVCAQDVAITSPVAGTTTDVVEKCMELLPIGPVVFLDTAGIDDSSVLAPERRAKTEKIFDRADIIVLIATPDGWSEYEQRIVDEARKRGLAHLVVVNRIDEQSPCAELLDNLSNKKCRYMLCSSIDAKKRNEYINEFKTNLLAISPDALLSAPALIEDLVPGNGTAVLIVPIDLEAPKGRIILPQVQVIRGLLDSNAAAIVVKETEYAGMLKRLKQAPDIVVCDSQVSERMVRETPEGITCTTFSILFARYKGDLAPLAQGAARLRELSPGDKVLIAESCSHHPIEGDIGREKIPRWLEEFAGGRLDFDTCAGRDFPDDLKKYKVIISCGGCMLTRREMLFRIQKARQQNVPITNYGMCIAQTQGILERVLSPFPEALAMLNKVKQEDEAVVSHGTCK